VRILETQITKINKQILLLFRGFLFQMSCSRARTALLTDVLDALLHVIQRVIQHEGWMKIRKEREREREHLNRSNFIDLFLLNRTYICAGCGFHIIFLRVKGFYIYIYTVFDIESCVCVCVYIYTTNDTAYIKL
jgi:hypothetical protein